MNRMSRCFLGIYLILAACATPSFAAQPGLYAAFSPRAQVSPDFVDLVKREGATVVNISSTLAVRSMDERDGSGLLPDDPVSEILRRLFPPGALEFQRLNVGSGFVISEDGYILTNAHLGRQITEYMILLLIFSAHVFSYHSRLWIRSSFSAAC